jgi:hypothetical protein
MREDFFGVRRALPIVVLVLMAGAITGLWIDYRAEVAEHKRLQVCGTMTQAEVVSIVERSRTDAPLTVSVALPDGGKADVDVDADVDDVSSGRVAVVWCPGHDEPVLTQHALSRGPDLATTWRATVIFSALGAFMWFWVLRPPRSRIQNSPA